MQNNNFLSRDKTQALIDGLEIKQADGKAFLDGLVAKGYTIEGYNDQPKPAISTRSDGAFDPNSNIKESAKGFAKGAIETVADMGGFVNQGLNKGANALGIVTPQGQEAQIAQAQSAQDLNTALEPSNPQQEAGKVLEKMTEFIAPTRTAQKAVVNTAKGALEVGQALSKVPAKVASNLAEGLSKVVDLPTNIGEKAINFVSSDPQAKVVKILNRSTPDELARIIESAKRAAGDGEAPTPFELTGNKLADTAKILKTKLDTIGKAKSDIILPLREGLGVFKDETKPFITNLTKLKNSFSEIDASNKNVVQAVINDAKKVSTKMDADKLIDKLQDALYSGNQNQTIVQGSAVDKQLRGILKVYNDSLKASLPKEYSKLNEDYSKLVNTLSVVNKSLGDVVEGVPIRGASLIKQYFSPSGSKAKEIFDFIKKETNGEVDLAKEATLSKFAMELFDDTRANSLLSGIGDIPTTVGGVVSKVVEKVGGDKLQNAMRSSTIRKAGKLTRPTK